MRISRRDTQTGWNSGLRATTSGVSTVLIALLLTGCSAGGSATERDEPSERRGPDVLDVGGQEAADWPVLRTGLDPVVPSRIRGLPSLIEDPPGRALLSYHPPEPLDIGEGWGSETLLFLGSDGDWRRLRMDDLGLPDARRAMNDGYGAGALSPDGRWWLGPAYPGAVLLDLETGEAELLDTGHNFSSWLPDSSGFLMQVGRGSATYSIETRQTVRAPYDAWQVGLGPDLQQVSLRRTEGGLEVLEWKGSEQYVRGVVPMEVRGWDDRPFGPHLTDDRAAFVNGPNEEYEIAVVDTEQYRLSAALRLENDDFTVRLVHGWLDSETLLLEGRQGLVAWRPGGRTMHRVVDVPAAAHDDNWDVSIAPAAIAEVEEYGTGIEHLGANDLAWRETPGLPAADAPLPSVLDDPPGRARIAYHPPEWWDDAAGWASETVLLEGVDGRWRRLDLSDLGPPESAWPGSDTYGSGELSPDGRWWAGKSRIGVILLDLRSGEHRLVALDTDWVAQVKWLPDSSGFVVAYGLGNRSGLRARRVTVPDLRTRPVPYEVWEVGFEPDGTPLTLRRTRRGDYDVVASPGPRAEVRGSVSLPLPGRLNRAIGTYPTTGRYAVITQNRSARLLDLVVLDAASNEVEDVLRLDQGRVQLGDLWWLDPRTLLIQARDGLFVWDLRAGAVRPITTGPGYNGQDWWAWTLDVATDVGGWS